MQNLIYHSALFQFKVFFEERGPNLGMCIKEKKYDQKIASGCRGKILRMSAKDVTFYHWKIVEIAAFSEVLHFL